MINYLSNSHCFSQVSYLTDNPLLWRDQIGCESVWVGQEMIRDIKVFVAESQQIVKAI